jgi:polyhydroxybutyrate depolymerase
MRSLSHRGSPARPQSVAHWRYFRAATLILVLTLHPHGGAAAESGPDPERTLVVPQVPQVPQVDDLGFVRALLARLESDYAVDRQRVYATGFSNGAFVTQRLACVMTADFAAVASVSGQMSKALSQVCKPTRPISVLLVHGTSDPIVPYDGGRVQGARGNPLLSVAATAAFWQHADACPGDGTSVKLPDASPADGTHVRREEHAGCAAGTEVTLYSIKHGGHTWPDGPQYDQVWVIGNVSRALDASAAIWEFLASHPLPAGS